MTKSTHSEKFGVVIHGLGSCPTCIVIVRFNVGFRLFDTYMTGIAPVFTVLSTRFGVCPATYMPACGWRGFRGLGALPFAECGFQTGTPLIELALPHRKPVFSGFASQLHTCCRMCATDEMEGTRLSRSVRICVCEALRCGNCGGCLPHRATIS